LCNPGQGRYPPQRFRIAPAVPENFRQRSRTMPEYTCYSVSRIAYSVLGPHTPIRRSVRPPSSRRAAFSSSKAADFYRQLARSLSAAPMADDPDLTQSLAATRRWWPAGADLAADCLDRTLDALAHIDRNAHPANIIYAWLDDLARTSRAASVR